MEDFRTTHTVIAIASVGIFLAVLGAVVLLSNGQPSVSAASAWDHVARVQPTATPPGGSAVEPVPPWFDDQGQPIWENMPACFFVAVPGTNGQALAHDAEGHPICIPAKEEFSDAWPEPACVHTIDPATGELRREADGTPRCIPRAEVYLSAPK